MARGLRTIQSDGALMRRPTQEAIMSNHPVKTEAEYINEVVHKTRDSKIIMGVIALVVVVAVTALIMFGIVGNLASV
jgi:hypothetical protein